ncbi:hypothetical protein F3Y22_tig00110676pilonHSYRG00365 [Hibiscus syriacus]|uniref:stearoyl-[acyl-carrier-protein] 9-desaturase n=1 Tax=Hibiscus syriacus TaxID=106335 RepID=A0A6A2ZXJ8_HIBSY|nr:hypothetical protein F3Y22_tig00110676pilonHSYRG00365 [Hibiscus syriacus]
MPPREVHVQVTHSMPPRKIEIFKTLEDWAENNILNYLKPVEKCWQPHNFLPDPTSDGSYETKSKSVGKGQRRYLMITLLFWARTAEENRHGDLLNKYLYLSGRVDMRQIEKTIQYLIGSGMVSNMGNFIECCSVHLLIWINTLMIHVQRITHIWVSSTHHSKKGQLSSPTGIRPGDINLAQICSNIASDEKRQDTAYTKVVEKLFEIDPDATLLLKDSGFTLPETADILEFPVNKWKVTEVTGLSADGRKAQDYVCGHAPRI